MFVVVFYFGGDLGLVRNTSFVNNILLKTIVLDFDKVASRFILQ